MTNYSSIRFAKGSNEFFATVNQRVNHYFKSKGISRNANAYMVIKTIFMFVLFFTPYTLIITGVASHWAAMYLCWLVMGLGIAGIGLSIMHDANHGSYSSNTQVNQWLGLTLNMVGGSSFNWKVQHNVLHHTYTNIHEVDEDISPRGILRMAPESKWKPIHQYQHWYAWFFYGLLTIVWIVLKDYGRIVRYTRDGLLQKQKTTPAREWTVLLLTKVIYFGYTFAIPMLLQPISFWQVLIGFFIMHYVAGFILSIIFQPAHVIDGTEYPQPDESGNLENNWAIHQLRTTTNFAHRNRVLSWYVGGLNYQVEHHLFPQVCHIHYRKIAPIVERTAQEFGLPYKKKETFIDAVVAHAKLMKELGKKPQLAVAG